MVNQIEVSVLCLAYNHSKYIEKALESIISQNTDFAFEIIVHDDASTDGTREIIKQYEQKFPEIIKPIYESENQMSQGIDPFMHHCMPMARGKYIAICECDDFWTDDTKLQRQYDILETNAELDMCACRAEEVSVQDELVLRDIRPKKGDAILTAEETILGGGGYLATASLFFRKSIFDLTMNFEKILCIDYTCQIKGALRGGIYYLDRKMAAYRKGIEGSWTARIERDEEKRTTHLKKVIEMLRELDKETKIYHMIIEQRMEAYRPLFEQLMMAEQDIKAEIAGIPPEACKRYLWGLGLRGNAFQKFCNHEKIKLNGVCDLQNKNVGDVTEYGYTVVETDYVFNNSDMIFASNERVYYSLIERGYLGHIVNLQKYLPLL